MKNNNRYLKAAEQVLAKNTKPMHYEQITKAALNLGVLISASNTPEVSMSSALSKEISTNLQCNFERVRPGVYSLKSDRLQVLSSDGKVIKNLGAAIHRCSSEYEKSFTEEVLIHKAVYILRRINELKNSKHCILIRGEKGSVDFDTKNQSLSLNSTATPATISSETPVNPAASFLVKHQLFRQLTLLKNRLNLVDETSTLILAIDILRLSRIVAGKPGKVSIEGARKSGKISIIPKNKN